MLDRVLQQGGQGSRHALINSFQQCDGPEVPWPPAAILGNQNCPSLYHPAGQVSIAIYCFPHRLRDLAKASKGVAKTPFFGKFYLMWSKECVKTTTML